MGRQAGRWRQGLPEGQGSQRINLGDEPVTAVLVSEPVLQEAVVLRTQLLLQLLRVHYREREHWSTCSAHNILQRLVARHQGRTARLMHGCGAACTDNGLLCVVIVQSALMQSIPHMR